MNKRLWRSALVAFAVLSGCGDEIDHRDGSIDARDSGPYVNAHDAADTVTLRDAGTSDIGGGCYMISPPAVCGDAVCDPGCETPIDCPVDCPPPAGGIPCTNTPATWTCNATGTARYQCYHGHLVFDACGAAGSCHSSPAPWPAQCHGCSPCNGWNSANPAIGQPFVWSCIDSNRERARCVDMTTAGDCVMGRSNPANCCVLDDVCSGGACVGTPLGSEDYCPM